MIDVSSLTEVGLNIFLSSPVSAIPSHIYSFSDNQKLKTMVIIGHGGKKLWEHLPHPMDGKINPIDEFSKTHMKRFASVVLGDENIEILFPHPKYTLPLQQLGRFFNLGAQTPLGYDISNEFGLWFAYRGVFLTTADVGFFFKESFCPPCVSCSETPCIDRGRSACPYQNQHEYTPEQQRYHASQLPLL